MAFEQYLKKSSYNRIYVTVRPNCMYLFIASCIAIAWIYHAQYYPDKQKKRNET